MSDSDVPLLRRRSNQNPRIGSGFNNQPENPVHIFDEDVEASVEVEERDGAPGVVSSGVHEDPLSCFRNSGLIPDSVCTQDTLAQLREDYRIPDSITLSLLCRGYDAYTPPNDVLLIHKTAFECEVRLPFHPTLRQALIALELAPL